MNKVSNKFLQLALPKLQKPVQHLQTENMKGSVPSPRAALSYESTVQLQAMDFSALNKA